MQIPSPELAVLELVGHALSLPLCPGQTWANLPPLALVLGLRPRPRALVPDSSAPAVPPSLLPPVSLLVFRLRRLALGTRRAGDGSAPGEQSRRTQARSLTLGKDPQLSRKPGHLVADPRWSGCGSLPTGVGTQGAGHSSAVPALLCHTWEPKGSGSTGAPGESATSRTTAGHPCHMGWAGCCGCGHALWVARRKPWQSLRRHHLGDPRHNLPLLPTVGHSASSGREQGKAGWERRPGAGGHSHWIL